LAGVFRDALAGALPGAFACVLRDAFASALRFDGFLFTLAGAALSAIRGATAWSSRTSSPTAG
jgi:hypothetical protein